MAARQRVVHGRPVAAVTRSPTPQAAGGPTAVGLHGITWELLENAQPATLGGQRAQRRTAKDGMDGCLVAVSLVYGCVSRARVGHVFLWA